jgi:Zn-dependent protease
VQALDLSEFLNRLSYWTIPVLFAITLHEVAHGWVARYFGDRTAALLGRLSLNPLRHIDPIGTVLVPGFLLATSGMLFGWAKSVPVAPQALRHPRLSLPLVALAGPLANFGMAALWCGVLAGIVLMNGNETLIRWIASMAQAGIIINVILALFNLLPIPGLDGGRVLTGLLPSSWGERIQKLEPYGLLLVLALSVLGLLAWLFDPAMRLIGRIIGLVMGPGR